MIPLWFTDTPWLAFDIETTGLDLEHDRVVQLATLQIDRGEIVDEWVTLVNPGRPIPAEASMIHGITDAMVASAPSFAAVVPDLMRRAKGRVLLGYNAAHFDAPFLRAALARLGKPVSSKTPVDPLIWVREIDRWAPGKGRHKLAAACARHGVELSQAHDALADCKATWALFVALVRADDGRFPSEFESMIAKQRRLGEEQERDFRAWLRERRLAEAEAALVWERLANAITFGAFVLSQGHEQKARAA